MFRVYRMFSFVIDEIRQDSSPSVDESNGTCHYEIVGRLQPRRLDFRMAQIIDCKDPTQLKYDTPTPVDGLF